MPGCLIQRSVIVISRTRWAEANPDEKGRLGFQTCELEGLTLEERMRLWATGKVQREGKGDLGNQAWQEGVQRRERRKREIKAKGDERKWEICRSKVFPTILVLRRRRTPSKIRFGPRKERCVGTST